MNSLTIVAVSDTHGMHGNVQVPAGDVFVHCGDLCSHGRREEIGYFADWLGSLPHTHKLITPGNHDRPIEADPLACRQIFEAAGACLLINEGMEISGIRFWASPITPTFLDWHFMRDRGEDIRRVWAGIPEDVDVLMTHGPAYGHGGLVPPLRAPHPHEAGCLELLKRLKAINERSGGPQVHVFGHIHDGYGETRSAELPATRFINASVCTEKYDPTNPAQVVTLPCR